MAPYDGYPAVVGLYPPAAPKAAVGSPHAIAIDTVPFNLGRINSKREHDNDTRNCTTLRLSYRYISRLPAFCA